MEATTNGRPITEDEQHEIRQANQSGRTPVVFVHGLWLLPSSWDRWADLFRRAGYTTLTPGWPYDLETLEEAKAKHEVFTGKSIGEVANYFEQVIGMLNKRPVVIGHSFGGLLTEILAGRGVGCDLPHAVPKGPAAIHLGRHHDRSLDPVEARRTATGLTRAPQPGEQGSRGTSEV